MDGYLHRIVDLGVGSVDRDLERDPEGECVA
jgi:hypothetical protein